MADNLRSGIEELTLHACARNVPFFLEPRIAHSQIIMHNHASWCSFGRGLTAIKTRCVHKSSDMESSDHAKVLLSC
eukprot:716467-Amphidinium_carterae.2